MRLPRPDLRLRRPMYRRGHPATYSAVCRGAQLPGARQIRFVVGLDGRSGPRGQAPDLRDRELRQPGLAHHPGRPHAYRLPLFVDGRQPARPLACGLGTPHLVCRCRHRHHALATHQQRTGRDQQPLDAGPATTALLRPAGQVRGPRRPPAALRDPLPGNCRQHGHLHPSWQGWAGHGPGAGHLCHGVVPLPHTGRSGQHRVLLAAAPQHRPAR